MKDVLTLFFFLSMVQPGTSVGDDFPWGVGWLPQARSLRKSDSTYRHSFRSIDATLLPFFFSTSGKIKLFLFFYSFPCHSPLVLHREWGQIPQPFKVEFNSIYWKIMTFRFGFFLRLSSTILSLLAPLGWFCMEFFFFFYMFYWKELFYMQRTQWMCHRYFIKSHQISFLPCIVN